MNCTRVGNPSTRSTREMGKPKSRAASTKQVIPRIPIVYVSPRKVNARLFFRMAQAGKSREALRTKAYWNTARASGVFFRCQELGLQVGRDISLFGYDNVNISLVHTPAISSVAPPLHDIGRKCAQLVLEQIETHNRPTQRELLPCRLHLRDSVCPR